MTMITEFFKKSTIHGFAYISDKVGYNVHERTFWLIVTALGLFLAGKMALTSLSEENARPMLTTVINLPLQEVRFNP